MRPGKKDHRLLSSFLLLQLERRVLCDVLLVHRLFSQHSVSLRVDFYFEVSLFKLAKILPTTPTEK